MDNIELSKYASALLLNAGKAGAKGAGFAGFASKFKNAMPKVNIPSFHPAVGEAVIGGAVGGVGGYATADDEHKTRNAIAGVGLGALAGLGMGAAGRRFNTATDTRVNTMNASTADKASKKYDEMSSVFKPSTMSDEKVYEAVFDGKTRVRDSTRAYVNDKVKFKDSGMKDTLGKLNKRAIKGNYSSLKNNMRGERYFGSSGDLNANARDMAADMSNTEVLKNYNAKFVTPKATSNLAGKYNHKIFGGLRGSAEGNIAGAGAYQHHNDMASATDEIGSNLRMSQMFSGMFGMKSPLRAGTSEQVAEMGKTQAFKARYGAAAKGATKDFRAGTRGKHFDEQFKQQAASAATSAPLDDHAATLGMNMKDFTTKKQVNSHLRDQFRKHHPDVGGNEDTFKKVNEAASTMKGSAWFDKLASFQDRYLEKNAFNLARMGEAVVGAGIGGAGGYALSDEKNKWRNAGLGAMGGAAISAGANAFGRSRLAASDNAINNVYAKTKTTAQEFGESVANKATSNSNADSIIKDTSYKAKERLRTDTRFRKAFGGLFSSQPKGTYTKMMRNNFNDTVRDKDTYMSSGHTFGGDRLATDISNKRVMNDFSNKYVNNANTTSNVHGAYNDKFMGGIRGQFQAAKGMGKARMHDVRMRDSRFNIEDNLASTVTMSSKGESKTYYSAGSAEDVNAARGSQEFKDRYSKASGGGVRQARTESKAYDASEKTESARRAKYEQEYAERQEQYRNQRRTSYDDISYYDISEHKDTLGMSGTKFTTKKEVDRHIRGVQRKNHPDLGGDEQVMKNVNNASDAIRYSDWYEKLASYQGRWECA